MRLTLPPATSTSMTACALGLKSSTITLPVGNQSAKLDNVLVWADSDVLSDRLLTNPWTCFLQLAALHKGVEIVDDTWLRQPVGISFHTGVVAILERTGQVIIW